MARKKNEILKNLIWRFAEKCGAQTVSFLVWIILARILSPEDFGTMTIVNAVILILSVFTDSGLGNALIQKKEADDLDFSSVFYFNVCVGILLYGFLFFSAPIIAVFYSNDALTKLIRAAGVIVIISSIKNVQQAYVSRTMQFKKFFVATIGGTIISAILGIYMAVKGYGAWALIAQNIFNLLMDTVILWVIVQWRPKRVFSIKRLKQLLSYGWKILVTVLLDTMYNNMRSLVIGRVYTANDLAYYNKGYSIPSFLVSNISFSLDSVLFPVLSAEQDVTANVKEMTRKTIRLSSYLIWPMMIGLMAVAKPLVAIVLTEKWIEVVPYLCIFCFVFALWPIHTANLNAIKALGRSDLFLKLEIIKIAIGIAALCSTMFISVKAIAIAEAIVSPLGAVVNAWPNKKLLHYTFSEQLADVLPAIKLSIIMGICVYSINFLNLERIAVLVLQIIIGILVYIVFSKLFHNESFEYLLDVLKK